ncbi:F-BAR domain only protein 2-like isoform X2 [Ptychodera flava]|uniref:F-BAR domain only protein 2-like isoform X2 n=1 Tax=Ptychodera flava TaxID=63121 RepID=UPI00396A60BA
MTGFADNFWGEKCQGFDVLYHNMKHGQVTSKELADFIRERANVEENYSKNMTKLAKTVSNYSLLGTFAPYWQIIKSTTEKLASLHLQIVHKLQEIAKELQKYTEEQHKKQKSVKEEVSGTSDAVQSIHTITNALTKAKENYNNKCYDLERLKKENAAQKDIEKAEVKYKKAMDDYKTYVEKYGATRDDFEKKMTVSCKLFQTIEETHLKHMRKVLGDYNTTCESTHHLVGQVNTEIRELCNGFSIQKLIEVYVESKGTGKDKPSAIAFEECDVSNMPIPEPLPKEKLKKRIKKTKKKKNDKDAESGGTPDGDPNMPEVDEEGFTIRPQEVTENKRDSFYSSSGEDSDQEERRKIHVEIKPAVVAEGQGPAVSNSVDELKAAIGGLTLSPSPAGRKSFANGETKSRKNGGSKPSNDLIGLDLFGPSPATTPTGGSGVLSPMTPSTANQSSNTTPGSTASADLWGSVSGNADNLPFDTPPALPAKQKHGAAPSGGGNNADKAFLPPPSSAASNSIVPPPRPPSRNKKLARSSPVPDSTSPFTLPRQDSSSSLSSMTFGASPVVGGSRGPSPLTLGMSDTIPIAAAFQECVNAYFKGIDQSKCMVKITGEMMISFPAGIIQVLTSNPSPAVLTIRIQNSHKLEQVLPNKPLVSVDESLSTENSTVYVFNMSALVSLLKRQSDQNVTASYFNVDILKYQVKALPGVASTPLQLCTYWKCDPTVTELRVDYRYNSSAMAKPVTLSGVQLIVPVDGGVTVMQSKPPATWSADSKRALWKLNDIQPNIEGANSLRAKFDLSEGPSKPATVAVQFTTEGTTLSGIDIEIVGTAYRLSLVKKRFASGKYLSDS